tara:strand:- start:373 stop:645 length:273 start_codon:yes stop_codon:yes gene_type:complete
MTSESTDTGKIQELQVAVAVARSALDVLKEAQEIETKFKREIARELSSLHLRVEALHQRMKMLEWMVRGAVSLFALQALGLVFFILQRTL